MFLGKRKTDEKAKKKSRFSVGDKRPKPTEKLIIGCRLTTLRTAVINITSSPTAVKIRGQHETPNSHAAVGINTLLRRRIILCTTLPPYTSNINSAQLTILNRVLLIMETWKLLSDDGWMVPSRFFCRELARRRRRRRRREWSRREARQCSATTLCTRSSTTGPTMASCRPSTTQREYPLHVYQYMYTTPATNPLITRHAMRKMSRAGHWHGMCWQC